MALNKDSLGQELYDAFSMDTKLANIEEEDRSAARDTALADFKTFADTVIKHIIANMEIDGSAGVLTVTSLGDNVK